MVESLEQAAILSDVQPQIAVVDHGYKGVVIDGVKVHHPGLRRGITRDLRAMIRHRSAIEPSIVHIKSDGKLDRNWFKGTLGDAIHAVLCGAGYNLRMILRKLWLFLRPDARRFAQLQNHRTVSGLSSSEAKTNCLGRTT
ncbi:MULTISPECIES: hypothetical protein [Burkholderiaceae]|uniref:hypothetical protein n=1 Tax=Burkholderiaceae TaxID=119060 RepID=UPI0009772B44|nr:hypothetical protein [Burkholderia sp. b14]